MLKRTLHREAATAMNVEPPELFALNGLGNGREVEFFAFMRPSRLPG
jgi:hypothetical protein